MKVLVEYFGLFIFSFVVLVGSLVAMSEFGSVPETSVQDIVGLGLAFVVITGGFSWYYFATSPSDLTSEGGSQSQMSRRNPPR